MKKNLPESDENGLLQKTWEAFTVKKKKRILLCHFFYFDFYFFETQLLERYTHFDDLLNKCYSNQHFLVSKEEVQQIAQNVYKENN